jgi:lipopolysaccharide export system permease protein
MNLLDRQLIVSYVKSYLGCVVSLLGLYVVVDLFMNIDDFAQGKDGLLPILAHIGTYYGMNIWQYFDRMCEAMILLAAMFTVAQTQRNNELLPLLSAGVSTHRVIRPVLFCGVLFLAVSVLNQEFVIPYFGSALLRNRDDPDGEKDSAVNGVFDSNGIHYHGELAQRRGGELIIRDFSCVMPETYTEGSLINLHAKEARYVAGDGAKKSGWLLTGVQTHNDLDPKHLPPNLEMLDVGSYFVATDEVDFEVLTRRREWFRFASTSRLFDELSRPDSTRLGSMAVLFHMRLTRPILGLLLVVMGLGVILQNPNRKVFISAGMCLVLCAVFFAACFLFKHLGDNEYLTPALAAWMPVLMFGPLSVALFDAIHT